MKVINRPHISHFPTLEGLIVGVDVSLANSAQSRAFVSGETVSGVQEGIRVMEYIARFVIQLLARLLCLGVI
jgi:hypothetical protein